MDLYGIAVIALLVTVTVLLIILLVVSLARKSDRADIAAEFARSRQENAQNLARISDSISDQGKENIRERAEIQKTISESFANIASENERRSTMLTESLNDSLDKMRTGNEQKLEEMRRTVGEKLDSTLNERLDSSFRQVSERLENLYRSFGEMKELSAGVTDNITALNRVLTNVKARGTWAEVQLRAILDETLPGRYVQNYTPDNSQKRVEFAVKIPSADGTVTYLPIDSKFPMEDYSRLCSAAETSDEKGLEESRKKLCTTVMNEAKAITKYILPPSTTPFAIMYLATEGLYNEILSSDTGIAEKIRTECSVIIAGPSTIIALLNSLSLSFTNIAINEKTEEIRELLLTMKSEYDKFAQILDKAEKKISEAGSSIEEAKKRTEQIQKKLKID